MGGLVDLAAKGGIDRATGEDTVQVAGEGINRAVGEDTVQVA